MPPKAWYGSKGLMSAPKASQGSEVHMGAFQGIGSIRQRGLLWDNSKVILPQSCQLLSLVLNYQHPFHPTASSPLQPQLLDGPCLIHSSSQKPSTSSVPTFYSITNSNSPNWSFLAAGSLGSHRLKSISLFCYLHGTNIQQTTCPLRTSVSLSVPWRQSSGLEAQPPLTIQ